MSPEELGRLDPVERSLVARRELETLRAELETARAELETERKARLDLATAQRRQRDLLTRAQAERDVLQRQLDEAQRGARRLEIRSAVIEGFHEALLGSTVVRDLFALIHYAGVTNEEWSIADSRAWVETHFASPSRGSE